MFLSNYKEQILQINSMRQFEETQKFTAFKLVAIDYTGCQNLTTDCLVGKIMI